MGRVRVLVVVLSVLGSVLVGGPAVAAASTPVPTPTPEPPRPGPGGVVVGGPRLGGVGYAQPAGARPLPRDLSARGWVLADLDSGDVLAARDAHGRFPPASTQKWLTALTLLPQLPDRRRRIVATEADVNVDGTRVGLVPNGRYSLDLLFQAMLMASGNDAANALARVAGGVPHTLALMNGEARHLRAYDTHAATPSGLDGPGQLTSAYDLALVARAALARADFRKYTAQRRGVMPAQSARYRAFEFANGNRLLYDYRGAFGGKNGFTDAARHTFIGAARRGGRNLVVTMMYGEHKPTNIAEQAGRLLDWGFALPRSAGPVGVLVDPAPATPTRTPGAPSAPSASPSPARAAGAAPAADGRSPVPLVAAGLAAAVLLGGATFVTTRRRHR